MSDKTAKSEAIAPDNDYQEDWQREAVRMLSEIRQLSELIANAACLEEQEPLMPQWVMKRGEIIQNLLGMMTPERIAQLPPGVSQDFQERIGSVKEMDKGVNQAFQASMAAIHQQLLGLRTGKTTLRGYHLAPGNQSSYTRSNDV